MRFRIQFNGREYASLEDMPAEERRRYEVVIRNLGPLMAGTGAKDAGIPSGPGDEASVRAVVNTRIVVNGREYGSADELPPDIRRLYDEATRQAGGPGASNASVTFSVTSSERPHGSAGQHIGPPPALGYSDPDPGAVIARFTGRVALAVASLFAIGVAVWLLFGAGVIGTH